MTSSPPLSYFARWKAIVAGGLDVGLSYADDMSVEIPTAEVLAHEIALVNHIQDGEDAVAAAEKEILRQIQEVL